MSIGIRIFSYFMFGCASTGMQSIKHSKSRKVARFFLGVGLQNIGAGPLRKESFTVCRMEWKHIGVTRDDHLHYGKTKFGVGEIHDE